MSDAGGRLCDSADTTILQPATGGTLPAAGASDRGSAFPPTPPDPPPRPSADSPGIVPPVVLPDQLIWRPWTPALEVRVGRRAWSVWRELVELRDPAGDCRATAAGIGRRLVPGLTRAQVQEQLDRLRTLGLVAGGGWRYAEVPTGTGRSLVEVYERRVVGDRIGARVGLPAEVWQRLDQPRGWGGARQGAGRKRRGIQDRSVFAAGAGDSDPQPTLSELEFPESHRECGLPKCPESLPIKSRSLTEVREEETTYSSVFLSGSSSQKKRRAASRAFSPSGFQRAPGATAPGAAEAEGAGAPSEAEEVGMDETRHGIDGLPVVVTEEGTSLTGQGVRVEVSAEDWAELPPYPGVEVLQPATIPSPPRVQLTTSEDDRVQLLLTAYSLTCRRQLPGVFNPHDRHPLKPGERKLLLAAAEALCGHEVSPLRWTEFSFDQWQVAQQAAAEAAAAKGGAGRKRKPLARPPLKVVFSTARIAEHAGWCRHERERRGQQLILTRACRTVLTRWQQMRAAILRGEMTPAAAREKFFPGDSYQRQIDRAREEARREAARIATSIAAGEYLW